MATRRAASRNKLWSEMSDWEKRCIEDSLHIFQCYMSIRLHFDMSAKYSIFSDGLLYKIKLETLIKRVDRGTFVKIARKFNQMPLEESLQRIAAGFMKCKRRMYPGYLLTKYGQADYEAYNAINKNFNYSFLTFMRDNLADICQQNGCTFRELYEPTPNGHPWAVKGFMSGMIDDWVIIGLLEVTQAWSKLDDYYKDDMFWPDISKKLRKIQSFYLFDPQKSRVPLIQIVRDSGLL